MLWVLLGALACGPQVVLEDDAGGDSGTSGGGTSAGGASSVTVGGSSGPPGTSAAVTSAAVTTDPITTTTTVTTTGNDDVVDEVTGPDPGFCEPPCRPGQECIAGICFGEPTDTEGGCDTWGGEGSYGPCAGLDADCEGAACIVDDRQSPTIAACSLLGCRSVCDCPDPGDLEGVLVCDELTGDGQHGCFFTCAGGNRCPAGMTCFADAFCGWGVEPAVPTYGDCSDVEGPPCEAGECVMDSAVDPSVGVCAQACDDVTDCPPPPVGGAPACATIPSAAAPQCILTCESMTPCPMGMECVADAFCAWPAP